MAKNFLAEILHPSVVRLQLKADNKEDVIRELIGILDQKGILPDPAEACRVVLEREKIMSTGMENGVAIPHGKTDTVGQLFVAMAIKSAGIEFDCVDGRPAQLFILTVSPASSTGPHIRFMAEISRVLADAHLRKKILEAQTENEIVDLVCGVA